MPSKVPAGICTGMPVAERSKPSTFRSIFFGFALESILNLPLKSLGRPRNFDSTNESPTTDNFELHTIRNLLSAPMNAEPNIQSAASAAVAGASAGLSSGMSETGLLSADIGFDSGPRRLPPETALNNPTASKATAPNANLGRIDGARSGSNSTILAGTRTEADAAVRTVDPTRPDGRPNAGADASSASQA